jgi:hypothetical protein
VGDVKVEIGDRLRVTDPQLAFDNKVLTGTVEAVDKHNGFILVVDGDAGGSFRTYFKAERKGEITVERLAPGGAA